MANPHLVCIVGARPNFMKMAPLLRALERHPEVRVTLVHTGQHYDANLSQIFFDEIGMRAPDVSLEVGSGKHGAQTARILERFEEYLEPAIKNEGVSRVVVVGDVNSTLACTLVAAKLHVPVAHVEAGLRSFDRTMPEEINRIVTDALCDRLLVSEPDGMKNLRAEGRPESCLHLVGNIMIDTLFEMLPKAKEQPILRDLELAPGTYGVVTLHRPANVDEPEALKLLVNVLCKVSARMPLVFAVHPRTQERLKNFGLDQNLAAARAIRVLGPQGYLPFLALTSQAKCIITDSGGLQEESTALGVPCLTMRPNTERPITVTEGTSTLVGSDTVLLEKLLGDVIDGKYKSGKRPELWDGQAARRMAAILAAG
ncbi:MAG TPA: UDP-N-acetylglucosamine 2-epimerase (non-hydrolyzing) [Planctomycetia bacterium]|nr:UDP-N-acetylglucosamine 2-epimerase (non-hydrolyzing) [Planctomycetia bacterium]